ncbi:Wvd2-like [Thalictrum thalictroides]|uniref:Wvd2-like n=1 Tax=Thalictrum thalictroides TaxID=46969 RepID=A0A7J6XFN3_THATH|nr:Wvd2-like [Thalictrum thalictroides]
MAGEIEEFISSEAISLHSGSISFGRFESEPLCWERRSSFSHNRYLEEVEKYSTPGSVTQKKAYFEAHFKKKKALLCEASESCDGMTDQLSEIDDSNHTNDLQKIEHDNQGIHFTCYYGNMDVSDDHGGSEVTECEKEWNEISPCDFQMDPFVSPVETEICDLQPVVSGELSQTQFECDTQKSINEDPEVEKPKVVDEGESVDRLLDGGDQLPKNQTTANDCVEGMQKLQKPNVEASVQDLIQITSDTSKECEKDTRRAEKESIKIRKEKQPLQKVISNKSIPTKISEAEDSKSLKARPMQDNRSGNSRRLIKTGAVVQPLGSDKSECKLHHSSNRPKRTANICLPKPEIKPSTAGFSLRSDERAEKRKQFYMKLEEKIHAKEAEVNQIQAKTQEEKEAQLKELRRSLNFKATPMPSFYNEAVSQGSENKKAASSNTKSTNLKSKSMSPGSSRSPAFLTPSKQPCLSTTMSKNVQAHCPSTVLPSEAANGSPSPSTSIKCTMQTGRKIDAAGKKERVKQKDVSIQRHCDSESSKPKKGARVEGRRAGNRNSASERIKIMKGKSIGEGSGVGRLSIDIGS